MDVPHPDGIPPEDLLARADALRDEGAWADAAEIYAAYLRRNPEHWQIWVQYGHCTKECGDAETALLLYREAEKLRPAEADIHLHLGHALKVLDRRDEASEAYSRALSLDPANAAARAELLAAAAGSPPVTQAPPATAAVACVFDASDLLDYVKRDRTPTGIQRVQLNLIEHCLRLGPPGTAAAAFDPAGGAWKPIPREAFERLAALSRSGADPSEPDWKDAVSAALDAVRHGAPLSFAPGGMLVALGTAWWLPNYLLRVRELKDRHGLRYVPIVHDCIPVVRPEHCDDGLVSEFAAWFAGACLHADAILAISDNTRDDVLRLRRRLLPGAEDIPVPVLPLHAGPLMPETAAAHAPPPRRRPYVLFVSTIESRKNHLLVFNAWLSLIRRHGAEAVPDLVCVGKRGWKAEAPFALLAGSRTLRERVFLLHDVPDTELDALYRHCLCTVFNSHYEGWGLPVTESIGYGKVPVVADNSSLRQAGGEAALFFATGSEPELVARLEAVVFDAEFRAAQEAKVRASPPPRRWDEPAADLVAALAALPTAATPPRARFTLRAGADYATRALPGPEPTLEKAIADGVREGPCWGRLKEWGVRALRGCAVLRLPAGLHGTARITLEMQGPPGGGRFGLRAGTADAVDGPFRWIEATDHERLFCVLEVPDAAGRELAVEIDTPEGSRLDDGRLVGPNLLGFMVCGVDDLAARLGYLERKALAKMVVV